MAGEASECIHALCCFHTSWITAQLLKHSMLSQFVTNAIALVDIATFEASFTLTTIKLSARSAVTTRPIPGVTYQGAPTLDAAAKTRARERSAQMIQGGIVAAELDAYKPRSGWRAGVEKVCRVVFASPTAVMLFITWGTQSLRHAILDTHMRALPILARSPRLGREPAECGARRRAAHSS